jgi:hypothetical protein
MRAKAMKSEERVGERGLPIWPSNKPVPVFKTEAAEREWWNSYDREPSPDDAWAPVYEPQATRHTRAHVYRVRFDDAEMGILQALARPRGVPASVVLRELVRAQSAGIAPERRLAASARGGARRR